MVFLLFVALRLFAAQAVRVACVGDSIMFGYKLTDKSLRPAGQLGTLLNNDWESVKNGGLPGATLLEKGDKPYSQQPVYQMVAKFQPDLVIIKLGTNDSKDQNWLRKADFVTDYLALIEKFRALDSKPRIWLCYPIPAFSRMSTINDTIIREEIIPMIDEVARKAQVEKVIDLYTPFEGKREFYLDDGVHPNLAGVTRMAELIYGQFADLRKV
jgi:acyl-CoA thioesterase I